MGVMSSKYFKSMLVFAMLFFLWQPAWGLVKTGEPPAPKQGEGGYSVNFNTYVNLEEAKGSLTFAITPIDSWATIGTNDGILATVLNRPDNGDVGTDAAVTITVTDSGETDLELKSVDFVLIVGNENDSPVFVTNIEDINATEGQASTYAEIIIQDIDIPVDNNEEIKSIELVSAPPELSWLNIVAGTPDADGNVTITLSGTPNEELSLDEVKEYSDIRIWISDNYDGKHMS